MMQRPSSFHLKEEEYKIILTYTYDVPTVVPTKNIIEYTVTGDGTIRIQGTYQGVNGLPELPVYGMDFKLKKDLNRFEYFGFGPEENYIDRNKGARLGLFTSNAVENMSNYLTVATSVQRRVLSLLISEIQTGFWAKARPAEHVPFWDDVEVLVGTELGFSEKAALRNYNFVNLDFFSQNEEKLLDLAREVLQPRGVCR